jgi:glycosyltransferase involved in cell wall biosynthesis
MTLDKMCEVVTPIPDTLPVIFAFIGRFDDYKEPMLPLIAMKNLRKLAFDIKLWMVGNGLKHQVRSLKEFVSNQQLGGCVEFKGYIDDIGKVYKKIHALIMPSRGDAFGRVTAEAMAYGRPVIGANACATRELITDGFDGLLFRKGDADNLAEKMRMLIQNPGLLQELGANASRTAQEKFTIEKYTNSLLNIYGSVLKQPPKPLLCRDKSATKSLSIQSQ